MCPVASTYIGICYCCNEVSCAVCDCVNNITLLTEIVSLFYSLVAFLITDMVLLPTKIVILPIDIISFPAD